jgi:hypothetical protein
VTVLIDAAREAASQPDSQRRLFLVPNAHVTRLNAANGVVTNLQVSTNGANHSLPINPNCAVILALGTIESTRLALASFPTSPNNAAAELMGRNLMAHIRSNIFVRIRRSALDPGNTLPNALQAAALLVRGSTTQGKFHIQVTASGDPGLNSDALLFSMIPDIDQLEAHLANQQAGFISIGFRGVSQMFGDQAASVPNSSGRWINLSPFESDEFGIPRAFVRLASSATEDAIANAMDTAILGLANQLAGNNPAGPPSHQSGPRRLGHHVSRSRNAMDGDKPTSFGDRHKWPLPSHCQCFLCGSIPVRDGRVGESNVDWTCSQPESGASRYHSGHGYGTAGVASPASQL